MAVDARAHDRIATQVAKSASIRHGEIIDMLRQHSDESGLAVDVVAGKISEQTRLSEQDVREIIRKELESPDLDVEVVDEDAYGAGAGRDDDDEYMDVGGDFGN